MTAGENKALVRRYYEAVYNERTLAAGHDFLAPSFVSVGPGGASMDLATHAQTLAMSQAALPDLHLTVEQQVAEDETVVTCWSAHGTQRGVLFGIAPTGREVAATAIHIHRVVDGRIAEQWEQFDALGLLRQLDALPSPQA